MIQLILDIIQLLSWTECVWVSRVDSQGIKSFKSKCVWCWKTLMSVPFSFINISYIVGLLFNGTAVKRLSKKTSGSMLKTQWRVWKDALIKNNEAAHLVKRVPHVFRLRSSLQRTGLDSNPQHFAVCHLLCIFSCSCLSQLLNKIKIPEKPRDIMSRSE